MKLLPLLLLALSRCLRADEVGPGFDAANDDAWEGDYGYYPFRTYQTTPLISPAIKSYIKTPECDDGLYTFLTPRGYSIEDPGTVILDGNGDTVWIKSTGGQAYDFVVQTFHGRKYLSHWAGDDRVRGHGNGDYYMLNSSYDQEFKISAMNGLSADLHEMVVTPEDTALLTVYHIIPKDVTEFRAFTEEDKDPNYIWDGLFQEIDIEKNELLFEWRASEHIALNESYHPIDLAGTLEDPFDFYHINSVQKDKYGNYIVSSRFTHAIIYIHGRTGEIIWRLGGKLNDFKDLSEGRATDFAWQHDARFHALTDFPELMADELATRGTEEDSNGLTTRLVTLFDNQADDGDRGDYSRGLLLEVTYPTFALDAQHASADLQKRESRASDSTVHTVRVVKSYDHPKRLVSLSQGSVQVIPSAQSGKDPKVLVGYGINAVWTEFASSGAVLCDNHFASNSSWERGDVQSYRVMKYPWVGEPREPPTAKVADDGDAIYVSWNGATEVKTWVLQHSDDFDHGDDAWIDLVTVAKNGFESELEFDEDTVHRYVRAKALDADGKVMGITKYIDLGWVLGVSNSMPEIVSSTPATPMRVLLLFICNATALFVLYELYRRIQSWKRSRRWLGGRYRVLNDEQA